MNKLNDLFTTVNKQLSLYHFSLPFTQAINFKGHQLTSREGLWLIEHDPSGQDFIGEICPLPGFSQETLAQCQQQLLARLNNSSKHLKSRVDHRPLLPSISFAVFCLQQQVPWQDPSDNKLSAPDNLIKVPLLQGNPSEIISRYQLLKYPQKVKIKVARATILEEVNVLKSLIKLNPDIHFRLDANQQWTALQYASFLTLIDNKYIDYIEEPTASLNDNITISKQFKVSIALDESLLSNSLLNDNLLPIHPCIKALIIKPTLIGYPERIDMLLKHAQRQQLNVSISASFESPLALNQLHYLAKQWQQQSHLKISLGLDTLHAFQTHITKASFDSENFKDILLNQATCIWKS
tara:strand:- start:43816 stop:44868 length:1053 start_codon:yes stop_codon:yes gene_type:complete